MMIKNWKLFNEELNEQPTEPLKPVETPSEKEAMWDILEKEIQGRAKNKDPNFRLAGPWKKFIREQSGYKVFIVDGRWIQNNLCAYFGHGGHGFVHEFIPLDEIWISSHHPSDGTSVFGKCNCKLKGNNTKMSKKFFDSTVLHEIAECEAMKEGKPFEASHKIALNKEKDSGLLENPYVDDNAQPIIKENKKIKNWNEFNIINENFVGAVDTPDGKISFYKNIQSFSMEIEPKARGLILTNGDLYVFDCAGESFAIHQQGIDCAVKLKILKKSVPFNVWKQSEPVEFICVQRKENEPEFYLSESYTPETLKKYYDVFKTFIDKAKQQASKYNASLSFFPTQIGDNVSGSGTESNQQERIPDESQNIIRFYHEN